MSKRHLPPGPRHPFLPGGALLEQLRDSLGFLQRTARDHGDLTYFRVGFDHVALFNHPDLVEEVLVTRAKEFEPAQVMVEAQRVIGKVLLTAEGDLHRRQRRLLQHAFMRENIREYAPEMVRHAVQARNRWNADEPLDMAHEMMRLTLGIASQTLFGVDIEDSATEFSAAFNEAAWYVGMMSYIPHGGALSHLPLPGMRHFHQASERLHAAAADVIARRRKLGEKRGDLLSMLIHSHEAGGPTADVEIGNEVLAILMAGHETTARCLTWTWYLLSQHPEVEARWHAEIDALGGRPPTVDDVPNLRYTEMIVAESLRIFPPIFSLERRATADYPVRDYVVPAGTTVIVSPFVMHRTPAWFPDPEKFDPERMTPEARAARPRYSYFPFGGGQRQCVGEPFAWTEASLVLTTLGQKWRPRLVPGHPIVPEPMMTLRPRDGLPMTLEARR
ncbi:MAG: cytochrome P450 [Gemmataceae bacterium]|nr:cytochrome P450 [Gemmataceae bacterium]